MSFEMDGKLPIAECVCVHFSYKQPFCYLIYILMAHFCCTAAVVVVGVCCFQFVCYTRTYDRHGAHCTDYTLSNEQTVVSESAYQAIGTARAYARSFT